MKNQLLRQIRYRVYLYIQKYIINQRRNFSKFDLKRKMIKSKEVSKSDLIEIKNFWEKFTKGRKLFDYKWFYVYNAIEGNKDNLKYYIPDDFWYKYIDPFLTNPIKCNAVDDKNYYDMYFADINRPVTIIRKVENFFLDGRYKTIDEGKALQLCKNAGNIIIKPSVYTSGGAGIIFWDAQKNTTEELICALQGDNIVVQEIVHQHSNMAVLHESSLNTIRIMVLVLNGEAIPLSSVVRMGINNAKVDNASSGGIVCGINADGSLKDRAYDTKANIYDKHPQGAVFSEHKIEAYPKCIELVKEHSPRFAFISKLQSWDLAIDENGNPSLIEVNLTYGQIDFHQMCNGPIFGERTEELLEYIFKNNKMISEEGYKVSDIDGKSLL